MGSLSRPRLESTRPAPPTVPCPPARPKSTRPPTSPCDCRYTEGAFSASVIAAHLRAVRTQATAATDNLAIAAYMNSGQVAATYKVEDMSMDVVVTFPKTFPLRTTEVVGGTRVGVSEGLWRKWLLSMAAVISLQVDETRVGTGRMGKGGRDWGLTPGAFDRPLQNGTIVDALLMWKADADRLFQGIEPCAICYCVVHGTNRAIPKIACRTCKHKFHSDCLVRVFLSNQRGLRHRDTDSVRAHTVPGLGAGACGGTAGGGACSTNGSTAATNRRARSAATSSKASICFPCIRALYSVAPSTWAYMRMRFRMADAVRPIGGAIEAAARTLSG